MNLIKTLWGFLFRLFPCPTALGLQKIGEPDSASPVIVTCNFFTTVKRLKKALAGLDVWLLVAESKGVNVWCAAGGEEFNTHSVVSAVKVSGIADMVDHRRLILPPLCAPGVKASAVREETGFKVSWGPVWLQDIPAYLNNGMKRTEAMKRVTYNLRERLDTGMGSLFVFYFLGALCFLLLGRSLLWDYLAIGAAVFFLFMLAVPVLPGKRGLTKIILPEAVLALALTAGFFCPSTRAALPRADLIIAMTVLLVCATELGGLASTMGSDLDPFLARLGIGAIGNVYLAGTVRTELLNGYRTLTFHPERCVGCRTCTEICPQGVWEMGEEHRAAMARPDACTACRACLVQCDAQAITAEPAEGYVFKGSPIG
ncbi:MAG: HgcAB-like fusion protein [Thermodesulfobacteriota bacterium]